MFSVGKLVFFVLLDSITFFSEYKNIHIVHSKKIALGIKYMLLMH